MAIFTTSASTSSKVSNGMSVSSGNTQHISPILTSISEPTKTRSMQSSTQSKFKVESLKLKVETNNQQPTTNNLQLLTNQQLTTNNKQLLLSLLSLLFLLITTTGWGQLLTEQFDYTSHPTNGLSVQSTSAWSGFNSGDVILVTNGNLSYSGLASSAGNKISFDGAGFEYARAFSAQSSGTVFYSFLLNVTSLGSLNTTGSHFTGFTEGTSNTAFAGTVWIRANSTATGFELGISPRTNSVQTVWTSTSYSLNTTLLVVVSYQFVSSTLNDVASLWVNPTPGSSQPSATLTKNNNGGASLDITSAGRIYLRQDGSTTTPFIDMDEIRVGTTWASVVPAPTLTAATLNGALSSTYGTASTGQSFTASGTNLTGNITVTAQSGFEVSSTSPGSSGYGNSVSVASGTTVWVRTAATRSAGTINNTTVAVLSGGGAASNANVTSTASGNSVSQLSITGTFTADEKIYDGTASATVATRAVSGKIGSDDVNHTGGTATFSDANVANGKTVTLTGASLTGTAAANYTLGSVSTTTANITAKSLTGSFTANNKAYDGTTSATVATRAVSGKIGSDDVNHTGGTATFADANVNTGITVTLSGATLTGTAAGNYSLSSVSTTTANITKANQTITFGPLANKITTDAPYTITATTDAIGLTVSFSSSNTSVASVSGNTVTINGPGQTTITASQAGDGNYNAATSVNQTLTVSDASTPTISTSGTLSAVSTEYGTASSSTSFNVSGANMSAGITITPPAGFEVSTSSTFASNIGTNASPITVGAAGAISSTPIYVRLAATAAVGGTYNGQNIALSSTDATTINIATAASGNSVSQKGLTITGLTGGNKEYDRSLSASFTGTPSYVGLANGESFAVTGTPSASFADATAANGKTITVSGYTAPSGNYSLTQPTLTGNITKKALTISSAAASNKTFDNNTNATITGSLSGVISPDVVTLVGTGTFASVNVANGISVTSTSTLTGADAGNYTLTQPTGLTANITKANQTITALTTPLTKVLSDVSYSAATTSTSGLQVSYSSNNTAVATVASDGTVTIQGLGSATITASQAGNSNYNAATDVTQALTVNPNPSISATPSTLAAFSTTSGTASTAQAFTVTGSNLIANITVTAPTGYEVSQTVGGGSGYAATQTLTQSSGSVSKVVYVRLTSSASGTPSGNVALTSTSATTVNIAVSGTVNAVCTPVSTTIFSENMGTPSATTAISSNTFQNSSTLTFAQGDQTTPADVRITSASSGYTGASGAGNIFFSAVLDNNYGFSIEGINASQYSSLTLDYGYWKQSSSAFPTYSVDYWNGSSWVTIANTSSALMNQTVTATSGWYAAKQLSLPSGAQINNLKIRFVETGGSTGSTSLRIDDVVLKGLTLCPGSISAGGGPLTSLSTTFGTASSATSFTLTGSGLGTTISIAALSGFEFNNPSVNSTYTSTLSGISATGPTTINVRLSASANAGTYSGNIVCSSGSTTLNVPMPAGTITATLPGAPSITGITPDEQQLSIAFTAGSTGGTAITNYEYSLNSGSWVAFSPAATASPLIITGLTNGTSYAVRIRAVNGIGSGPASNSVSATPSATIYYLKAGGSISNLNDWGTNTAGTTGSPAPALSTTGITWNVNNSDATLDVAWTLGSGSKVVVGDGTTGRTLTIPSGFALTGTVDVAASSTLAIANTTIPTFGTLNATSTIRYTGTAGQSVNSATYPNLRISTTGGNAIAGGAVTVTSLLTIDNGSTFSMSTSALSGSSLTTSGTGTLITQNTTSTPIPSERTWSFGVNYSSTSAQTVVAGSYADLNLTGGNRTLINGGTINISGVYTPGAGTLTVTNNTINFNGADGQTIPAGRYNNISSSNNSRTLANGNILIAGTLTPGSGPYTIGTSTVEFNGTVNQTIPVLPVSSGSNYYNLTYSGTTTSTDATIAGTLSVANNLFVSGSQPLYLTDNAQRTLTVNGNVTISGTAELDFAKSGSSASGVLDLKGNLTYTSTAISTTSAVVANGTIVFSGSGTLASPQIFSLSQIDDITYANFTINSGTVVRFDRGLQLLGANTAIYKGTLTVNGTLNLQGNSITSSSSTNTATFTINTGGTLITSISGGINTAIAQSGITRTFNAGANYTFNGATTTAFPTTAQQASFGNPATVNVNANITLNRDITVTNTLSLTSGALTVGANALTFSGSTINRDGSTFTGSINASNASATVAFTNSSSTGNVNVPASTFSANINNLTMNGAGGITLGSDITVAGTLTFTSGNITTGNNKVIISSTGSVSRSSGHVVGNLQKNVAIAATARTFEIGTGATYTPVAVTFGSVTTGGNLIATTSVAGAAPSTSSGISQTKYVNRLWTLTNSGIVVDNYSATFTFVAGDIVGGAITTNFIGALNNSGTWSNPTVGTKASTSTLLTGNSAFGSFYLGESRTSSSLSDLTISSGTLTPAFSSSTTSYSATVATNISSVDVTPTTASSTASVTINGTAATSGSATTINNLAYGANTITIVVTSEAGTSTTYTLTITRTTLSSDANLSALAISSGTLTPSFSAATTSYSATVTNATTSINVTPTVNDANATVTVAGNAVTSGSASSVNLSLGVNNINVVVTAEDGVTTKTYTISVTRPSNDATLSGLSISSGTLSPTFTAAGTSYTASVVNAISSVTLTPTSNQNNATIQVKVNAGSYSSVTSGIASGSLALNAGSNTIEILVTAQDGTTNTYTITVTREELVDFVNISAFNTAVTENFNTLSSSGTSSSMPTGWNFVEDGVAPNPNSSYTAGTGSSSTGDTYSFGEASSSERAFGGLRSNNVTPTIGAKIKNNTGSAITDLSISYTGETWRIGATGRSDRMDFQYSLDATSLSTGTWVDVDALDYTNNSAASTPSGNLLQSSSVASTISSLNIANGSTIWIRWNDFNATGSDDGMGIDDFSITASVSATPPTLTAATGATVDAAFNVTFTDNSAWRSAISSITIGGTTLSTSAYSISEGQITFTPSASTLLQSSGSKSIAVLATGYTNATVSQTIGVGVATKLGITTQPAAPSSNGGALGTQPVVAIQDQYGNTTASTATVSASVGSGTWTIGGTTSRAGVSGAATFTNLTATSTSAVSGATITFTSTGLTSATSDGFNIPEVAPANNNCGSATTLTLNAAATSGTLVGATVISPFTGKIDVWYKFVPTCNGTHTITVEGFSGDVDVELFEGSLCPSSTTFFDNSATQTNSENIIGNLTSGTNYFVRVLAFDVPAQSSSFTISVTETSCPSLVLTAPVANAATLVYNNGFQANWSSVGDATGYRLDVSTAPFATDLFISEYVEGSSSNKYIEIYNGTGRAIDLSDYKLMLFSNGSNVPDAENTLTGTITNGSTIVYKNNSATAYSGTASNISSIGFNGDDAIALYKISTDSYVDIFGRIGNDPGSAWTSGSISTVDKTLRRKSSVTGGVTTNPTTGFSTLGTEWDQFSTDVVSGLGTHSSVANPSFVSGYSNLSVNATKQLVTGLNTNTTYYYVVRATDATRTSANSNVITITTANSQAGPLPNIWVGGTNGSWNNSANWSYGTLPSTTGNTLIDDGNPVLDIDFTLASSGILTLSDNGSLVVGAGKTLTITGTADFGDRPVTLKSDATGTASIGQIGNNGSNLSGASAVTVERYMPGQRKWRMLTAPLIGSSNNSIYYNWQNNGTAAGSTGAIFWGPAASGGIYPGGVGYNILSFNSSSGNQGAWANVTNTQESGSLFDQNTNKSYIAFVTGPYNTTGNYITGSAVATTLSATGTLRTGQVPFTGLTGGVGLDARFHMIGNPYASAVNFSAINAQNVNGFYYVWNPGVGTLGAYQAIDRTDASKVLESGQAFLVAVPDGSTGSVTFDETDKSSTTSNAMFRTQNTDPRATMKLYKTVNGTLTLFDQAWVDYQPNANPDLDGNDALKPNNFTENMSIYRFGKDLMVERRPLITQNDTLQLRLWRTQATNYQIQLTMENFSLPEGSTAVLEDRYLNTSTPIVLSGQQTINFSVNADPASTGERFRIVFRPSVVTSVDNLNGARGFSVYPNPLAKGSTAQLEFRNKPAGKYTVTLYTITGVQVQQSILTHGGGTGVQSFKLASQLSSGTYIAEITNMNGVKEKVKVVVE